MYIASFEYLQLAMGSRCPTTACPVRQYLADKEDVLNFIVIDNENDESKSKTKVVYRLNLETEDIGNKFIEVYTEAQKICKQCKKQSHQK